MMIYDSHGRELKLRNGLRVPVGSMICNGHEWETVTEPKIVIIKKRWNNLTQSHEKDIEFRPDRPGRLASKRLAQELVKVAGMLAVPAEENIDNFLQAIRELEVDLWKAKRELTAGKVGIAATNLAHKLEDGSFQHEPWYKNLFG
jgi:hypothetical protein